LTKNGFKSLEIKLIEEEPIQPSFIVFANNENKPVFNSTFSNELQSIFAKLYFPITSFSLSPKELKVGITSYPFVTNSMTTAFLGTTIPPVAYLDTEPNFLEHPISAFEYYKTKEVTKLVCENKYMGSRCYVVAFFQK